MPRRSGSDDERDLNPVDARAQEFGDLEAVPGPEGPTRATVPGMVRLSTQTTDAVPMIYVARRTKLSGRPAPAPIGEHIDINVPTDEAENAGAAELYVENALQGMGAITQEHRDKIFKGEMSPESLHLTGAHYHFVRDAHGPFTLVHPDHVSFLEEHPSYVLRRATHEEIRARQHTPTASV